MNTPDIMEVIGGYFLLKRSGKEFRFLCPFHLGVHSCFYVDPERQRWRCHLCGARGDVIDFVALYERLTREEAIQLLADQGQNSKAANL